jgi:hypothetical protein
MMSQPKKTPKTHQEMTPEEREAEHLRRLREGVEAAKSGVLKVGKKTTESADDSKEK